MSLTGKLAAEKLMKGKISKLDVIYADAYELAVRNGYQGTIDEWLKESHGPQGEDGKSAYEVAKENGFKGTAEEWLESLKGEPGEPGKDGYTPIKGVDYFDGEKGDRGDVGGIATGTYVGTNEYGVNHPNSLTFDFAPKLLIVRKLGSRFSMTINLIGATEEYSKSAAQVSSNIKAGWSDLDYYHVVADLNVKVEGNTISWYYDGEAHDSTAGQEQQFNDDSSYSYIAISDSASGSGGGTDASDESGFVLTDRTTGTKYTVYVENGDLKMEVV